MEPTIARPSGLLVFKGTIVFQAGDVLHWHLPMRNVRPVHPGEMDTHGYDVKPRELCCDCCKTGLI